MKTSDIHERCGEIATLFRHNARGYRRRCAHRYATSHNNGYAKCWHDDCVATPPLRISRGR